MMSKYVLRILTLLFVFALPAYAKVQAKETVLPEVSVKSGMDYFDSLRNRASIRAYAEKELTSQDLGDVLWTAGGLKNPGGKWVVPFAMNAGPTCKIYVTSAKGTELYDGKAHSLNLVLPNDLRTKLTLQDFAHSAPYMLILVASPKLLANKNRNKNIEEILDTVYLSCGAVMQNIYLAASAKGLATCYIGSVKKDVFKEFLPLEDGEVFLGVMPLGYVQENSGS